MALNSLGEDSPKMELSQCNISDMFRKITFQSKRISCFSKVNKSNRNDIQYYKKEHKYKRCRKKNNVKLI